MKLAGRGDLPALSRLWQTCFGDAPETVDAFFCSLFDHCAVFAAEDCAAMAIALPVSFLGRDAAYFYAVCTAPERRGQGLSRRLMREAEEELARRGVSYAALVPAEASLFRFYGAMGYEPVFTCARRVFAEDSAAAAGPVSPVPPERYAALRAARPESGLQYPLPLLQYEAENGALFALPSGGCAAVERRDGEYFAAELLADDPEHAAASLCAFLGCRRLTARLPGDDPFGMAKSLDGSPLARSFLGLEFA